MGKWLEGRLGSPYSRDEDVEVGKTGRGDAGRANRGAEESGKANRGAEATGTGKFEPPKLGANHAIPTEAQLFVHVQVPLLGLSLFQCVLKQRLSLVSWGGRSQVTGKCERIGDDFLQRLDLSNHP